VVVEAVMAPRRASVPGRRLLHPRWQQRERRITATRAVREALVSLAGLLGGVVRNQAGEEVGRLVDVVARWADEPYPPVTGPGGAGGASAGIRRGRPGRRA
jgi:hypothetical protein